MRTFADKTISFLLGISICVSASAATPTPLETLRAKYPHGIPWTMEITGLDGKSEGALAMLITAESASSCLGEMEGGFRVDFTDKHAAPPNMFVASYGVAKFVGNAIKIDLTGGICDAYLLMSGEIAQDGSSSGRIYRFGRQGSHDVATYRALVKQ